MTGSFYSAKWNNFYTMNILWCDVRAISVFRLKRFFPVGNKIIKYMAKSCCKDFLFSCSASPRFCETQIYGNMFAKHSICIILIANKQYLQQKHSTVSYREPVQSSLALNNPVLYDPFYINILPSTSLSPKKFLRITWLKCWIRVIFSTHVMRLYDIHLAVSTTSIILSEEKIPYYKAQDISLF
jgi:hypothetical protein